MVHSSKPTLSEIQTRVQEQVVGLEPATLIYVGHNPRVRTKREAKEKTIKELTDFRSSTLNYGHSAGESGHL